MGGVGGVGGSQHCNPNENTILYGLTLIQNGTLRMCHGHFVPYCMFVMLLPVKLCAEGKGKGKKYHLVLLTDVLLYEPNVPVHICACLLASSSAHHLNPCPMRWRVHSI